MKRSLLVWILCVVVADVAVTLFVIFRYMASRGTDRTPGAAATIDKATTVLPNLGALRRFSETMHPRIGELLRSSWSGDPAALPSVLATALDEAEREARNQGLTLGRDVLKKLVEASVAKHGIAHGAVLREALKQVA